MAESHRTGVPGLSQLPPPPAPPLPPQRPSVLQRFIAPLAFSRPQRHQGTPTTQSNSASPKDGSQDRPLRRSPARNAVHRTSISIAAIDINDSRSHAILAGRDILKTVRVHDRSIVEELNIRNTVTNYISTQHLKPEEVHKRREFLSAKDVRWSHGTYSHVVATAAQNGRIALYDVSTLGSSRVELAWLYQHVGQVNKLDFDPHQGYMLLSGSQDKFCKIWDIRDPRKPSGYNQYHVKAPIRDVRWSPTNAFDFALCTETGVIQKWDVRNPSQHQLSINAHSKSCYTIAWHPDGTHIASGGIDKLLRVWDMKSELKGQKHLLQLRCPQGIMNLAWRPPSWSAEFAKRGTWQTCHIATSYTADDPRTHVWDLRRPLLPFRELCNYETRPTALLWADKDLLWTAGVSGMFVQSDMSHASQVEDFLPPGAVDWNPDGSYYAVVENRTTRRRISFTDPSAVFLNVPQDKLSGLDDGTASRSLTDDEGADTSFVENSRRQSRPTGTRQKSHPNTPPAQDNQLKVLPLDRAIVGKKELFNNGQVGAISCVPGTFLPAMWVEFVASNYAKPMTARERAAEPEKILPHLENAFLHNAKVCQAAEMLDVASNWRLMAEIIIPELKTWADHNRRRRLLEEDERDKATENNSGRNNDQDTLSMFSKITSQGKDGKSPARSEKVTSHLFRGVVESSRGSIDAGSHGGSNMTTPRQQPVLSSPAPSRKDGNNWYTLDEAIEPIQPLPPSLTNAHSTAAAASRQLLDSTEYRTESPMSSPERPRLSAGSLKGHRRSVTESATSINNTAAKNDTEPPPKTANAARAQTPLLSRNQEDRRAALRDYKASARQPFSLEAPLVSPRYGREVRHDSSESFPMFSASGGSSARARSLGRSFDVTNMPGSSLRSRQDSGDWFEHDGYYETLNRDEPGDQGSAGGKNHERSASQTPDLIGDESPSLPFGLDGASESKPIVSSEPVTQKFKEALSRSPRNKDETKEQIIRINSATIMESTGTKATDDSGLVRGFFAREHYLVNPFIRESKAIDRPQQMSKGDESLKSSYQASDFRPIDVTRYEPSTPGFAVSALPVICGAIYFDTMQGSSCSQFSAHLLSHVQPFFFHQSFRPGTSANHVTKSSTTLTDRLMDPTFSSRMIECIFATHIEYLRNLNLYLSAAELRKMCVEDFDYALLAGPEARTQAGAAVGDQLTIDPLRLKSSCSRCKNLLQTNATNCKNCSQRVGGCPICELPLTTGPADFDSSRNFKMSATTSSALATYCHVCGHSVHVYCMTTWLSTEDVNGECPTADCGCDCGPGLFRDQRILRQIEANQDVTNNRASIPTVVKRDSKVVGQIPAVDKARNALRKRSSGGFAGGTSAERVGEGDEKGNTPSSAGTMGSASVWSKKGTSAGTGRMNAPSMGRSNSGGVASASSGTNGGTSLGRRVRVVEPGE